MRNRRWLAALALAAALSTTGPAAGARAAGQPPTADSPRQTSPAAAYRLARPGYRFDFPRDHFDHPEFQTEWWYFTGNLRAADGHRFGFELTFFRQAVDRDRRPGESLWAVHDIYLAHLALSDLDRGTFLHEERVNRQGPGLAGVAARSDRVANDSRDGRADARGGSGADAAAELREGPGADAAAEARGGPGAIWNGNWRVQVDTAGGGPRALDAVAARFAVHLSLASAKPPVINGVNGVSQKAAGAGQASHYVSMTRLLASGRVVLDGRACTVEGTAWMDHEFFTNQLGRNQRGWDWLSLQLADGTELMVYRLRRDDGSVDPFSAGTFVAKNGRPVHLHAGQFSLVPTGPAWTSPRTRARYPIEWRVEVPSQGLALLVRTPLPSQELTGATGWTPTYWEGAVTASGTRDRTPLAGVGYLELTGYDEAVVLGARRQGGG